MEILITSDEDKANAFGQFSCIAFLTLSQKNTTILHPFYFNGKYEPPHTGESKQNTHSSLYTLSLLDGIRMRVKRGVSSSAIFAT